MHVCLFSRTCPIRINHNKLCTTFSGDSNMMHQINLRIYRVATPHNNQITFCDQSGVGAPFDSNTCKPPCVGQRDAERRVLLRSSKTVAQSVQTITLNQSHRSSIVVRPQGLCTITVYDCMHFLCDYIKRIIPFNRFKFSMCRFRICALQWQPKPIRVMNTVCIACNFGTHHSLCIRIISTINPAYGLIVYLFNLKSTGTWTIVWTS